MRDKLIERIDSEIDKKAMKTGAMGTETVSVSLELSDKEKLLFLYTSKYKSENYWWEFEDNTLNITYHEEI